jgi:predicted ester cyclase
MDRDRMVQLVKDHYRSFWQGDLEEFDKQLAPDFTDADTLGSQAGPGPAKEFARSIRGAFPDMTVTVEQTVVEGDMLAIRACWRGTNTGAAMGRDPTGRPVEFTGMVFWRFNDQGLIAERWAQIDFASMFRQLDQEAM